MAGVTDGEHRIQARGDVETGSRVGFVELDIGGLDRQAAAQGHGVAGVGHQVHQDLLDLTYVCLNRVQRRVEHRTQADVLANQPAEYALHAADDSVEAEHDRLHQLLAAEGEKLVRESPGLLGRLDDLLETLLRTRPLGKLCAHQVGVAHDRRQRVVEVVRDAARQPSDRFHLLRLPELVLQTVPVRDVADDGHHEQAFVSAEGTQADFGRELRAVFAARSQVAASEAHRTFAGSRVEFLAMVDVRLSQVARQQHLDRLAKQILPAVPKHGLDL